MTFLAMIDERRGATLTKLFAEKIPEVPFSTNVDSVDHSDVRYLLTWSDPSRLGLKLPNLEVLFSLGTGVDQFDVNNLPSRVKLVRLVAPYVTSMMSEYVAMSVLMLHREMIDYLDQRSKRVWHIRPARVASETSVGVMGLGNLGKGVVTALQPFGFSLNGWSRRPHQLSGVNCFSGKEGLAQFLRHTDILICLLPLTKETAGILNAHLFSQLPKGAALIQVGRGGHLNESALFDALEQNQLSAAILDVCESEPPPPSSPLWDHPRVLLTPHIAVQVNLDAAATVIAENVLRHRRGHELMGIVATRSEY